MTNYSKYHVDISPQGKRNRQTSDYKTGEPIVFSSLLEKRFYDEIVVQGMESCELIDYELQKKYILVPSFKHKGQTIRAITYVADFWLKYADGTELTIDTKGGLVDATAKLKRKLFYHRYPDTPYQWLTWTKATGWIDFDEYEAFKRKRKKEQKENP